MAFDLIMHVHAEIHDFKSVQEKHDRLQVMWASPPLHVVFDADVPAEKFWVIMRLFSSNRNNHNPLNFPNTSLVKLSWKEENHFRGIDLTKLKQCL